MHTMCLLQCEMYKQFMLIFLIISLASIANYDPVACIIVVCSLVYLHFPRHTFIVLVIGRTRLVHFEIFQTIACGCISMFMISNRNLAGQVLKGPPSRPVRIQVVEGSPSRPKVSL
jgi:hypothetical protein